MNRKSTALSVVLGLIGLGLHGWAKRTGFTPGSRLPLPQNPVWLALLMFTLLVPLLALLLALPLRRSKIADPQSLYTSATPVGRCAGVLGGLFLLVGSLAAGADLLRTVKLHPSTGSIVPLLVHLLLIAAGVVMLLTAIRVPKRVPGAEIMVPGFAVAFLLIQFYHTHAQDPVLEHYCWVLLALMVLAMGLCLSAGYAFRIFHPYWNYACLFTAGAWCLAASISATEPGVSAMLVGMALWSFWHCDLTVCHACPPGAREENPERI